jgi:hypothetical protein
MELRDASPMGMTANNMMTERELREVQCSKSYEHVNITLDAFITQCLTMVSRAALMKTGTAPKSMVEQLGEAKAIAVGTTLCTCLT